MCWVMTVGGQFTGNFCKTVINASTPPVEEPTATILRPTRKSTGLAGAATAAAGEGIARLERAAALTLSARSPKGRDSPGSGLPTQSKAPISSAASVASAPRWVMLETMMTGMGRRRMIFSRNSRPFMFGISMSSVTTSGFSRLIASRASSASPAWPMTLTSGSEFRMAEIRPRMVGESSTTRTRAGALMPSSPRPCRSGGRW